MTKVTKRNRKYDYADFSYAHKHEYKEEIQDSNLWARLRKRVFNDGAIWWEQAVETIENGHIENGIHSYDDVLTVTYWNTDNMNKKTFEKSRIHFENKI